MLLDYFRSSSERETGERDASHGCLEHVFEIGRRNPETGVAVVNVIIDGVSATGDRRSDTSEAF